MASGRLRRFSKHICPEPVLSNGAELVIRNATIIDGTGAKPYVGELAVAAGRIVYVGERYAGGAAREIDAQGKMLAPGFIDIHTHFDPSLSWDGRCDPSLHHGITTVITGNCSLSVAPVRDMAAAERMVGLFSVIEDIKKPTFDEGVPFEQWSDVSTANASASDASKANTCSFSRWLDHVRPNLKINVGTLIGHSAVRLYVMGERAQQGQVGKGVATSDDIAEMCHVIDQAMVSGAIGVSSSYVDRDDRGRPVPSMFATVDERIALARAMGRCGRGVWQVIPKVFNDIDTQIECIRELGKISREANVTVSFAPILPYPRTSIKIREVLEEEAKAGAHVYGQVTPRHTNMAVRLSETSMWLMSDPQWRGIMNLPKDERLRAFQDPQRQKLLVSGRLEKGVRKSALKGLVVGNVKHADNQKYRGRKLADIADSEGKPFFQKVIDISLKDDLDAEFRFNLMEADPARVCELVMHPWLQLGASDAGAHVTQFCGTGDTTLFLETFVKQQKLLPIERGIQSITSDLAAQWHIRDRGILREGLAADLVLFDMDRLHNGEDEFVHDVPGGASRYKRGAIGFEAVFVNGVQVIDNDLYTDAVKAGACGSVI